MISRTESHDSFASHNYPDDEERVNRDWDLLLSAGMGTEKMTSWINPDHKVRVHRYLIPIHGLYRAAHACFRFNAFGIVSAKS